MGDYFSASIEVGGPMTKPTLDALVAAIVTDGPSIGDDYGGGDPGEQEYRDAIAEAAAANEPLKLCDEQARSGTFESIEEFCEKNGLAFVRSSEAYCEFGAEIVWFQPGMKQTDFVVSVSGDACISVDDIRECMSGTPEEQVQKLNAYLALKTPPACPPIAIVV